MRDDPAHSAIPDDPAHKERRVWSRNPTYAWGEAIPQPALMVLHYLQNNAPEVISEKLKTYNHRWFISIFQYKFMPRTILLRSADITHLPLLFSTENDPVINRMYALAMFQTRVSLTVICAISRERVVTRSSAHPHTHSSFVQLSEEKRWAHGDKSSCG